LWSRLAYDRRAREGLLLAFVPDAQDRDASRVAGCFAVGLALHGGERTVYVSCRAEAGWLEDRLALPTAAGWTDVLEGRTDIAGALRETIVPGLDVLPLGAGPTTSPHPMRRAEFTALLDRLAETHAFVIVDLPGFQVQPEGPAVLRAVDAVILATHASLSTKAGVRTVLEAAEVAGAQVAGGVLVADETAPAEQDDEALEP
jgi:tyrosine-protein kinase Etk/Wzc